MYKRADFILVNIDCGSDSAQSYSYRVLREIEPMHAYWMIALQSIIVCLHVAIGPAFRQHHGVSSATVSTQVLTWWYIAMVALMSRQHTAKTKLLF